QRFGDMFATGNPFWSLIGGITQPIFHGGALRHQQKAAEAALEGAKAQYRAAVLQAFGDVANVLTALRTDGDALTAATRASDAADQALTFARR
ncbi:TolC family protein, partial [Clostridium perfringens]